MESCRLDDNPTLKAACEGVCSLVNGLLLGLALRLAETGSDINSMWVWLNI